MELGCRLREASSGFVQLCVLRMCCIAPAGVCVSICVRVSCNCCKMLHFSELPENKAYQRLCKNPKITLWGEARNAD